MTADLPDVGVVLMAYGTPASPEGILPYYTDIRRGTPPSAEQLADLTRRYAAIGGVSPLAERTEAQRLAVQAALDALSPGRYRAVLGLKHAQPTIEQAVASLADQGIGRIAGAVLAPHYSSASVGQYLARLDAAAGPLGVPTSAVRTWATEPALIEFLADDLIARVAAATAPVRVVFTAHSLPTRVAVGGDPYESQLAATAAAVAGRAGLDPGTWEVAWQSAGRTPEPWLGPDIGDVIDRIADESAAATVIVSACGFVADHLEVLYDLDIEAARRAARRGLAFDRTACVNDDPGVMAALATLIHATVP